MDGPPPGLDLSETQVPRILGINIATFGLAVLAIGLRFASRRLSRANFWWDDWLMLPAITLAGLMCFVSITYMVQHGLGKHIWAGPPDAGVVWAQGLFISELTYTGTICSIKFSLLCFYWRIFKQSRIRIPIYVLAAVVSCWGIAVFLITVFQCTPVSDFWNRYSPTFGSTHVPNCGVNVNQFFNGNSIPNIVTDAALLVLPIPFIWQLQLPRSQKMALSSIFLLGGFVVGVSIVRFTYIISLDLQSPDVTWNFVNVQIWTGVEIHVGIVCACLPSLRPLLNLVLFGSVDRPCRKKGSKKESGGPDAKSQTLWNSHLRSYQSGSHGGVDGPRKTIGSHAFIRLPDVTRTPSHQSMTEVPGVEMRGVVKGDAIGVRTDVYVDSYV